MKVIALGTLILLTTGCAKSPETAPAETEQPPAADAKAKPPEPAREVPPALAAIFKERNALHKRQTGAILTITAKWVHDPGIERAVRVYWTIDYDGPRRPFTILTPDKGTGGSPAVAHFWYAKPDGTAAAYTWGWGGFIPGLPPPKQKGMFSVAADGKTVSGELRVGGGSHLKGTLGREPGPDDPPLWAQLEYAPTDRGDGFDLLVDPVRQTGTQGPAWTFDAWTGHLWSPVVEVAVE
jgi:hypothetical protein